MHPRPWILAAAAALSCDGDREAVTARATAAPALAQHQATGPREATVEPPGPPAPLRVGERLPPVSTLDAGGQAGCAACRVGDGVRLVIFGSLERMATGDTLRDLDAIARLYADNGLGAVAIVAAFEGGRARALAEPESALARAQTTRAAQRVAIALDVALPGPSDRARPLDEIAAITGDPTVVLLGADDTVRWLGSVGPSWRELDLAITGALSATPPAP